MPTVNIIQYNELEDCYAAFYDVNIDELMTIQNKWTDGKDYHVWGMRRCIRNRKKAGTWGWLQNKEIIHVWIADHATEEKIIRLLAHELGHMQNPRHRQSQKEEEKAEKYADVALNAFTLMQHLKKGV